MVFLGPRYGIKGGYLFNEDGEPIAGASIILTGKDRPDRNDTSGQDGSFEARDKGGVHPHGYIEYSCGWIQALIHVQID